MEELSKAQKEVYNAIKEFIEKNSYSPTIRDLCKLTGKKSPATILQHVETLKLYGYIDYVSGISRTIRIKEK